jgi:hypothetical protein
MSYSFSIITGLIQLISLLMVVLLIVVLVSGLRYFSWKRENDTRLVEKLDKIIDLLEKN